MATLSLNHPEDASGNSSPISPEQSTSQPLSTNDNSEAWIASPKIASSPRIETEASSSSFPDKALGSADRDEALVAQPKHSIYSRYGDFCFGRKIDYDHSSSLRESDLNSEVKSYNTLFVELDGFKRTGTFPYFELPIEIRQHIMRLLVEPYFIYCKETKKRQMPITLTESRHTGESPRYQGDYETYLKIAQASSRRLNFYRYDVTSDGVAEKFPLSGFDSPEKFARNKLRLQAHPHRTGRYEMQSLVRQQHHAYCHVPDWGMGHLVRSVSNVNTQFRKELADIIWSRVQLYMPFGDRHGNSHEILRSFLRDRPGVHAGIKSLVVHIDIDPDSHKGIDEDCLLAWCNSVSKYLVLENLSVVIFTSRRCVDEIIARPPPSLLMFKELKVTENFQFKPWLLGDYSQESMTEFDSDSGDEDSPKALEKRRIAEKKARRGHKLRVKLEEKLTELYLPKSLRHIFYALTEIDIYLDSRASASPIAHSETDSEQEAE